MRLNVCLAALAATLVATPALAQQTPTPVTDSDVATARGVVLGAHSLKKSRDLDFGVVSVDTVGGTVTVAPSLTATAVGSGGVTVLTGTSSSAEFDGSAAPNEQVSLALSGPGTTSVQDGAGHSIPVVLTLDAAGATRNADAQGGFKAWVGGTFTLAGSQAPGVYSNLFTLTATYQ